MLTKTYSILYKAFYDTKLAGILDTIMPPPNSFAFKPLGLPSHSTLHNNKTTMNTRVKHFYMRALPLRYHSALQKWALLALEEWLSPLDHNSSYLNSWSKNPRGRVFGAIPNAFLSKFSGFSVYHPVNNDQLMQLALRHATYSAIANNTETATCMFLSCWGGRKSTNPYSKLLNAYPHY